MNLKEIFLNRAIIETLTVGEMKNVVGGYAPYGCFDCNYSYIWYSGYTYGGYGTFCGGPLATMNWAEKELEKLGCTKEELLDLGPDSCLKTVVVSDCH